jgi:DNA-binding transcriptional ArsR family regulator
MESEEGKWDRQDITIGTILSVAKRDSAIRILKYLADNSDALTVTEISESLDMDWGTVKNQLFKLTEAGFLTLVEDKMDARCKYYQIADKKATEKAIELWEDRQRKLKKKEEETKYKQKEPVGGKTKQTEPEEVS